MALEVGELYAKLSVDSKGFDKGVEGAKNKLSSLGQMASKTFSNIGAMATKAVGGVGALGGAVAGLAPAVAGVGGLASSFASAGIGAVAFGAVAVSALGQVFEASENVAKLEEKIANADSAEERIKAQQELAKVYEGMSQSQAGALQSLQSFKSFWGDFVKQFETPIFDAFGESMALAKNILTGLAPTISNVAGVVRDLIASMNSKVTAGGLTDFFTWLETNGAEALRNFAIIAGNSMQGFFNLMMAFAPMGATMEEGLIRLTEKFVAWSASLTNSNGFQAFVDYAKANGPVLLGILGDVFSFLGNVIKVLAPIGSVVLQVLGQVTSVIATTFDGIVDKLSGATGAFDTFKNGLTTGFQIVWSVVGPLIQFIGDKVMEVFGAIVDWWNSNGSALLENISIVFQGIWSVIQFIMPAILMVVEFVFNSIKGVITGALDVISGVFAIFAGLFTGNWSKMWDGVKQLLSGAVELIWNIINLMFIGRILSGLKMLGTKALSGMKSMWSGIQNGFNAFVSFIDNLVSKMVSGVTSGIKSLVDKAVQNFNTLRTFGANIWNAIWQVIKSTVDNLVSGVTSAISGLKSRVSDIFNGIKSTASSVWEGVKSAITKPIESAKSTVLGVIDTIKGAFSNMKITIPKPKLPKINVGSKDIAGVSIPTFSVDWFKTGGIATGPAIAGIGEAGSEAIIPLSGQRMKPFAYEIAKQMAGALGGIPGQGGGQPVVVELSIDGRQFARATTKYIEEEQTRTQRQDQRARGYNVT